MTPRAQGPTRPREYYAHSHPKGSADRYPPPDGWQPLSDHLRGVAKLSREFAEAARPHDESFARAAYWAGMLHDLGKYDDRFQRRLMGDARGVEHSGQGASLALTGGHWDVAFAVAGHHSGIPCCAGPPDSLKERCARLRESASRLLATVESDAPDIAAVVTSALEASGSAAVGPDDLRVRMLFSCLVDADRLDTERFRDANLAQARSAHARDLLPEQRLDAVLQRIRALAAAMPRGPVREARQRVVEACLNAAGRPDRFYSLTVPTGGGKTLASLIFALKHAAVLRGSFERIIVVIPYLSIIEQNAGVYRDALGEGVVLEHHSAVRDSFREVAAAGPGPGIYVRGPTDAEDEPVDAAALGARLATENWDAPIVVTTSVRFFESLFSNRPSDCRRLHNLARAIVVLDEVQTIPQEFFWPVLSMMDGLAREYGTTFVFSTATQPPFQRTGDAGRPGDRRWAPGTIVEIVPEDARRAMDRDLKRVEVVWPAPRQEGRAAEATPWAEICARMIRARRALCIVNTREQARSLFENLRTAAPAEGIAESSVFHLSTRMCPQHRQAVLAGVRAALLDGDRPCLVASTQLVEAGVDLDFPIVFRAMAPFDSIIQAAGRCDREGRLTAARGGEPGGRLEVFETEDGRAPAGVYTTATERTRELLARSRGRLSIHDPDHIRKYYESLYAVVDHDARQIEEWRGQLNFPEVAERFQLIADGTRPVLIPWDEDAARTLRELAANPSAATRRTWRTLQPYVVGLYPHEFRELASMGAIRELFPETDVWVAVQGVYDPALGLTLTPGTGSTII